MLLRRISFSAPKDPVAFADAVLGIVWAWNFAGLLGQRLLKTAREVLLRGARAMDSGKGTRPGRCAAGCWLVNRWPVATNDIATQNG